MESKNIRRILFNSLKQKKEGNSLMLKNLKNLKNLHIKLPMITNNQTEIGTSTKDIENIRKQIHQVKINVNEKKKELQFLKIQYNKLIKENRGYKKLIYEVLDLHDEAKNNIERNENKEIFLDSSYISEEQLLNKINECKIDKKQKNELIKSFEILNLKDQLNIKRKLLLNKKKEFDELKHGTSVKNIFEMNSKLETIRVNGKRLQNEVLSLEGTHTKKEEIISKLEKEIKNEERENEKYNKQLSEYETKYNNKLKEMKEIEKDLNDIDIRRKIQVNKMTNNTQYEGSKLKGLKLKSKIVKIRNDIDKLEKYETEKRGDLKNLLEQRRKIVTDLRNKCIELENKIYDLEQKNNKLFTQVKINEQEKIAFENRGKEQIKDIKRLKELEKVIFELKLTKEQIIKELEEKQKYLNNIKNGNDKKNNIEEIKEVKENEKTRSRNENQNDNLKSLENQENKDKN